MDVKDKHVIPLKPIKSGTQFSSPFITCHLQETLMDIEAHAISSITHKFH